MESRTGKKKKKSDSFDSSVGRRGLPGGREEARMAKEGVREKRMVGIWVVLVCIWVRNPSFANGTTDSADGELCFNILIAAFLFSFW